MEEMGFLILFKILYQPNMPNLIPVNRIEPVEEYTKTMDGQLSVSVIPVEPIVQTFSYDRILNEIQAHSEALTYWGNLKNEADKLNLKR